MPPLFLLLSALLLVVAVDHEPAAIDEAPSVSKPTKKPKKKPANKRKSKTDEVTA
jgi:hypothetical protein